MIFNFLFKKKKKKKPLQTGDVVVVRKTYLSYYPFLSKNSLLTVEKVQNDEASVIFMTDEGKQILRKLIPVIALAKVA